MFGIGMPELIILIGLAIIVGLIIKMFLRRTGRKKEPVPSMKEETTKIINPSPKEIKPKLKKTKNTPKIFISYRRNDSSDITGRIYDRLVQHFGSNHVFKDVDSIPLGVDFKKHLDFEVAQCDFFIAVIGANWLYVNETVGKGLLHDGSDFVRIELESALQRGIPIIPLFVQNSTMPNEKDLPDSLKQLIYRNGTPIRPDPDFHNDMDRLIRAIEIHFLGKDTL